MPRLTSRNEILPLRRGISYFDTDLRYRARRELRAGLAVVVYERAKGDSAAPGASEWRRVGSAFSWNDAMHLVREHRLGLDSNAATSPVDLRSTTTSATTADDIRATRPASRDEIDLTDGAWAERPERRSETP